MEKLSLKNKKKNFQATGRTGTGRHLQTFSPSPASHALAFSSFVFHALSVAPTSFSLPSLLPPCFPCLHSVSFIACYAFSLIHVRGEEERGGRRRRRRKNLMPLFCCLYVLCAFVPSAFSPLLGTVITAIVSPANVLWGFLCLLNLLAVAAPSASHVSLYACCAVCLPVTALPFPTLPPFLQAQAF